MFRKYSFHRPHYFRKHLSRQLEELYLSVALLDLALAAVVLFEPIYLYNLGYSISYIMLYYVVVYGAYFFLLPFGGKFLSRFGPEKSILLSSFMLIGYYLCLALLPQAAALFWIAPLLFALEKTFYWPAYHTDFLRTSDQGERGREFSGLWSLSTMMYIIGPIMGGVAIKLFGFVGLFIGVMAIILFSNLPLFFKPVPWKPESFDGWKIFWQPFKKIHLRSTLGYLALGEELILMVIWPIYIALTFKDNYLSIGGVVAGATLITALVTLYIGKVVDDGRRRWVLRWSGAITALIWVIRPLLKLPVVVFISDACGRIFKNSTYVSMTAITYEHAQREGQLIARSILYEQGFAIAKTLMALAVVVLAVQVNPFTAAFILAAVASLGYLIF